MSQPNKKDETDKPTGSLMGKFSCSNNLDDPANYEEASNDEYSEELDEEQQEMYESMKESNFGDFVKKATDMRRQGQMDEACNLLKILISKASVVYQDELHFKVATYYYQMGKIFPNF